MCVADPSHGDISPLTLPRRWLLLIEPRLINRREAVSESVVVADQSGEPIVRGHAMDLPDHRANHVNQPAVETALRSSTRSHGRARLAP